MTVIDSGAGIWRTIDVQPAGQPAKLVLSRPSKLVPFEVNVSAVP
ncbi:hypothetical protein J2X47_003788 [Sphingomonas sp. BE270]|jgi:hypothetical protein|nr:hypothetical protein [Sphingomonas sp. BE270]